MGIITGSFGLILGLLFLIFPQVGIKLFPSKGKGFHKEDGKVKFGIASPLDKSIGERKAKMFYRILGAILIVLSIFAFLSGSAP